MKRYLLKCGWEWEAVVEIDHDRPNVAEDIRLMVEFWSHWEEYLEAHECDYTRAFLSNLGTKLALLSLNGFTLEGLIDEMKGEEGYAPLDGSIGIRLVRCDEFVFDDIEIEEVAA